MIAKQLSGSSSCRTTPGRNHDRSSPTSHLADYCNGPAGSIQPIVQGGRDLCLTPVVEGVILDQPKVCCERVTAKRSLPQKTKTEDSEWTHRRCRRQ